ncbi:Peroxisome biogenesis protein 19-1 [Choanephora cucurbitarum]|uniref:Peroxisome biogenesis protein 19-1 n=1 Tax=Choanephora cucurbitarum TaxID=101091 RepID=A0A1C7NDK5_9FUNG|nr:Peroxisome biogenesis protein 19-1 [Choanephora cucurbitarum]
MTDNKTKTQIQDDDSDFDDLLDDVLDDMSKVSVAPTQPEPVKQTEKSQPEPDLDDLLGSDDFAKQLAANMEQLMGQMGTDENDEMKQAFEKVWSSFDKKEDQTEKPRSFQETIGKTMNKLKDSSKEIDSSMAEESEDAFMAELMKQMESLADNGEFEGVLEGMMSQLMSKDLLYEPMKDLSQKYPAWLETHEATTEKAELEKYRQQYTICQQIVAKYEASDFDEKNEAQSKEIMDLMTKMQELGQPPAELLDEMAPGMNFGNPESMPDMKDLENCTIM